MSIEVPHLNAPFSLTKTGAGVVEQNTAAEILACVRNIVSCPIGFRTEQSTFGISFPQFRNAPLPMNSIVQAVETWEPRATVTITEEALTNEQERRLKLEAESEGQ